jgi:predicted P-loop ATPase
MHIPQLQRGRALIITGPQACGKSTLAREIAGRFKHFAELGAEVLDGDRALDRVVDTLARVLIVDGLPRTPAGCAVVKQLITQNAIHGRQRYGTELRAMRPPLLIFTTNDTEAARHFAADGRRFDLLDMAAETATH